MLGDSPVINCSNNLIIGNTLTGCLTALLLYDSSNNTIYHNNLIANTNLVEDTGLGLYPKVVSINTWDNGYPSGGNYWSDHKSKYSDVQEIDSSGIGNKPYVINSNKTDHYPFLQLFSITSTIGSVTSSPTPTSTVPEFSSWKLLLLVTIMVVFTSLICFKKTQSYRK